MSSIDGVVQSFFAVLSVEDKLIEATDGRTEISLLMNSPYFYSSSWHPLEGGALRPQHGL
jgi:hypothetical protein